jgi:hypothetical protein
MLYELLKRKFTLLLFFTIINNKNHSMIERVESFQINNVEYTRIYYFLEYSPLYNKFIECYDEKNFKFLDQNILERKKKEINKKKEYEIINGTQCKGQLIYMNKTQYNGSFYITYVLNTEIYNIIIEDFLKADFYNNSYLMSIYCMNPDKTIFIGKDNVYDLEKSKIELVTKKDGIIIGYKKYKFGRNNILYLDFYKHKMNNSSNIKAIHGIYCIKASIKIGSVCKTFLFYNTNEFLEDILMMKIVNIIPPYLLPDEDKKNLFIPDNKNNKRNKKIEDKINKYESYKHYMKNFSN